MKNIIKISAIVMIGMLFSLDASRQQVEKIYNKGTSQNVEKGRTQNGS